MEAAVSVCVCVRRGDGQHPEKSEVDIRSNASPNADRLDWQNVVLQNYEVWLFDVLCRSWNVTFKIILWSACSTELIWFSIPLILPASLLIQTTIIIQSYAL